MTTYIKTLFEEKGIDLDTTIDLEGHIGLTVEILFDFITNLNLSDMKIKSIEDTYRKIDFQNGDIMHYTKFLAKGMIQSYSLNSY